MARDYQASAFVSLDVPSGHDTVWGWLAKNEPEAIYFMDNPGADATEFEDEARKLAGLAGVYPQVLPAPPAIPDTGGPEQVLVFPDLLLRAVFARR